MKKLIIENCLGCPFMGYKSTYDEVANVPYCRKKAKDLPYTTSDKPSRNRVVAIPTVAIPEWCPLEND